MTSYDVIIIGAGHNGIIAAAKLAKSGRRVLVLEASITHGGMAQGSEFVPGHEGSPLIHSGNQLSDEIVRELSLDRSGVEMNNGNSRIICLSEDSVPLVLTSDYRTVSTGLSDTEREDWARLKKRLEFQASLLKGFMNQVPPQEGTFSLGAKARLANAALKLKRSGTVEMQEFLRMALMCIADIVDEELTDDRLKGLLAFDSTLGIQLGPRSPTSVFGMYYRLANLIGSKPPVYSVAAAGRLMNELHETATKAGVEFRFNQKVRKIIVNNGAASGVITAAGEEISAKTIVSAIHPKTTFSSLVGAPKLDTGFARDIAHIRSKGNVSKLNLVLDTMPVIGKLIPEGSTARFVHARSIDHVETGFNPSKYGELPNDPSFEFVIEPQESGITYVSVIIQNTPHDLKAGWQEGSKTMQRIILSRFKSLSPGIERSILSSSFLSPIDIEQRFNVEGGHWHHGELQVDRLFSLRPVFGAANYQSPIDNLYICGAGTHPGGGINGASGLNAAKAVLQDLGAR